MSKHAIIWLDHSRAKVFHIGLDATEAHTIKAHAARDHKGGQGELESHLIEGIVKDIADSEAILVTGPGNAKLALLRALHAKHPLIEKCVVGVETLDHPTDGELIAHARKSFAHIDAFK